MGFYKKVLGAGILASVCITPAVAQSGTNSPYSQYGLGLLNEQSSGFNRGMNGLGLAFREHNQVNYINPASYSALDSLTFIFDAGLSGQITNFNENGHKINANNADFEYAVAAFRAFKHVGVSFGIVPFTNVGYNYAITDYLNDDRDVAYTNTYSGSGGIHQVYFGAGWEFLKGLSVGANISYLWGDIDRSVINSYSDGSINTLSKYYTASVKSYKLDVGLQYQLALDKKNALAIGLTYGLGHKLGTDPTCNIISTNTMTAVADTASFTVNNGLEIPTSFGAGVMWNHANKLKLGADFSYQQWGSLQYPVYRVVNDEPRYELTDDYYKDRYKVTVGGEFCNDEMSRRFFDRIRFRAGVSYATSYYKINGLDGPDEISASIGFGIPIVNAYNNRSVLNISGQWVHSAANGLLTENTFRINIGITFNERWFMKWKVD
ncbi:hypothetical protein [Marseilla massiliensis]|jgi:hypothetical protein|uniref:Long-chain fatty acid transport protein n=1 Tax=Marseilla massiliensis TaxID=1841864 RepID=A0A939B519_9BACT|nr:hypothetical protein [Marseilla massiliensis]MBM6672864.1 hypothetical protein [Marseilla massiliensis]CCY64829.1 putative uncharacterized protein [Prevotella sp. CAG:1124]